MIDEHKVEVEKFKQLQKKHGIEVDTDQVLEFKDLIMLKAP